MSKMKNEKIKFQNMSNLVYGRKTVLSFLKTQSVKKVFLDDKFAQRDLLNEINKLNVPVEKMPLSKLNYLTNKRNHQGIAAIIKEFKYLSLEEVIFSTKKEVNPLVVILDEIQDPHNFGAILRTCAFFNVKNVIIKKHNQVPLNATVAKVSTGALNFVNVCQVANLSQTIEELKKHGFWIVSTDVHEATHFSSVDYHRSIALILGSEGKGVSPLLTKRSDYVVQIPVMGPIDSLNVSVAAGILISHIKNKK